MATCPKPSAQHGTAPQRRGMAAGGRFLLAVFGCCCLAACGPSDRALEALGSHGEIQRDASVRASTSIVINAPPARVWAVLVDVSKWPRWLHGVSHVAVDGALGAGASFGWHAGDTAIRSRVVLFVPDKTVAWTGRATFARAIHVLTLSALGSGRTRVDSAESMDGPMLSWFYSSSDLQSSEDEMLKNLKVAAEAPLPLQASR